VKVLVCPCSLQLGGSEINAVDLAAAVQQRGHEAVVFGRPGPLAERARDLGLRVVFANTSLRLRPSPLAARELRDVVRRERPDIVHAYEGYTCTEAFYAVGLRRRTALVGTLYTMSVDGFIPRTFPAVAGTAALEAELLRERPPAAVFRLDPPVDVVANAPDPADGLRFRAAHGISPEESVVAIVSRLDLWLKMDSLTDAITAAGTLAADRAVRLLVVGDGMARETLTRQAEAVNAAHGRQVVIMTGPMVDPVPAYRAADVVIGMGTSLLRGMATGKPTVLVGELGFVEIVRPDTMAPFLQQGFWGVGAGEDGAARLSRALSDVLDLPGPERAALGEFGRQFVTERFGLEQSADILMKIYQDVLAWSPDRNRLAGDLALTPAKVLAHKVQQRLPAKRRAAQRLLQGSGDGKAGYEATLATPLSRAGEVAQES
jgi:glycosyltransferase involved in cell wall biosynthesis